MLVAPRQLDTTRSIDLFRELFLENDIKRAAKKAKQAPKLKQRKRERRIKLERINAEKQKQDRTDFTAPGFPLSSLEGSALRQYRITGVLCDDVISRTTNQGLLNEPTC